MLLMLNNPEYMADYEKKKEVCDKLEKKELDEFGDPVELKEGEDVCLLGPPFKAPSDKITWFLNLDFTKDDLADFETNVLR